MNVIDLDILLYAYDDASAFHGSAKSWLEREFNAGTPTGLTLPVILGFVRIVTDSRMFASPLTIRDACAIVDEWLAIPTVHVLAETARHWPIFKACAENGGVRGPLVPDAVLAATAMEHGATLCTHDRDFKRFDGLRVEFPLQR